MSERESIATLAEALVAELSTAGMQVATAESCTGGWIAAALTDISGSSQCFGWGAVSYSDAAKTGLLGVSPASLETHGAVSEAVVREMATGILSRSGADLAVAVSGIAGPGGGSAEKPVGTVWIAWARARSTGAVRATLHRFSGDREAVRAQTVIAALQGLRETLRQDG